MTKKTLKTTKTAQPKQEKPRKALKPLASRKTACTAAPAAEKASCNTVCTAEKTVDGNLGKLAASPLPGNFVKEHNGCWNHQDWLGFLAFIKDQGFDPIDPDRVGLILEEVKIHFSTGK